MTNPAAVRILVSTLCAPAAIDGHPVIIEAWQERTSRRCGGLVLNVQPDLRQERRVTRISLFTPILDWTANTNIIAFVLSAQLSSQWASSQRCRLRQISV